MTAAFTLCTRKRDQQLPQLGELHKNQSGSTAEIQLCGEEHLITAFHQVLNELF